MKLIFLIKLSTEMMNFQNCHNLGFANKCLVKTLLQCHFKIRHVHFCDLLVLYVYLINAKVFLDVIVFTLFNITIFGNKFYRLGLLRLI